MNEIKRYDEMKGKNKVRASKLLHCFFATSSFCMKN